MTTEKKTEKSSAVKFIVGPEGAYKDGRVYEPGEVFKVNAAAGELPSRTFEATDDEGLALLAEVAARDEARRKAAKLDPTAIGTEAIANFVDSRIEGSAKSIVAAERAKNSAGIPLGKATAPVVQTAGDGGIAGPTGKKTESTHPAGFQPDASDSPDSKDASDKKSSGRASDRKV